MIGEIRLKPSRDVARLTPSRSAIVVLLAIVFLALHLPYLPSTLEDLDSINFALGLHRFDVARHQPHPPGYPVFIAIGKASRALIDSDAKALAAVSVAAGTLGVFAIAAFFVCLRRDDDGRPVAATALAVTSPLYWMTAARPLSDTAGLAAAVGVQALTLASTDVRGLAMAAFCAGLAAGIRSQVFWLTTPLLIVKVILQCRGGPLRSARATGQSSGGPCRPAHARLKASRYSAAALAFGGGILTWFAPLVMLTGGPNAYWRAVSSQGAEDLSGIRMLWTTPTARELLDALYYAFVAPWAIWPFAIVVLGFATLGIVVLARRDRRALWLVVAAFGPYLVFDIVFQETFTSRYALPLTVPIGFLAASGMRALPGQPALVATVLVSMLGAHIGGRSIAAYSREPAPAFRMLADMRAGAQSPPVLAPDRRESFDLRRPLIWLNGGAPQFDRQLGAPPQHEWLESVKYWNDGGRASVWFVVDPRRSAIDLVQHDEPARYRWSLPYPLLMSGTRPSDADWYKIDRPDWYVGNGWALTPEAAGVSEVDRRGLAFGPIDAWVERSVFGGGVILVGGRNFEPTERPRVTVSAAALRWSRAVSVTPGGFFELVRLPFMDFDATVPEYVKVTVAASPPSRVAIEQFDASSRRAVLAFGDGWHEPEYDPSTGRRWRWLSDRAELRYLTAPGDWSLHVVGESPKKYYARDSRFVVRQNGAVLRDISASDDFSVDIALPAAPLAPATLTIETDQTHVPADTSWRGSPDHRRLGLRIYRCELRRRQTAINADAGKH